MVYELEDKDLGDFAASNAEGVNIVLFYAPWCGYCKKMFPEFAKAATASATHSRRPCLWAQLNADRFPDMAKQVNVTAFPTTLVFERGQLKQVVPGAQDAESLLALAQ